MLRPGQLMVCCALALLCVGVVMVNSAGLEVGSGEPISPRDVLTSRPAIYMALALGTLGVATVTPIRAIARTLARPASSDDAPGRHLGLLGLGTLLLLAILASVYVPGLGRAVNGSYRWIGLTLPSIGYVSIQPSEIVKWLLLGLVAWYAAVTGRAMGSFGRGLGPSLVCIGTIAGLTALEDLGTGALIGAATGVVLLAAGVRIRQVLALTPLGGLALAGAVALEPYRFERLRTFLSPYADPEGAGYHMIQSMATIAGGDGWGRGLGNGLQKFGYLPEDQTDFLLAIIAEELGIAGAGLVIALLLGVIWSGWLIARREPEPLLKLLAIGVVATVGLQALINIAVVAGWAPTKGIALPLVSAGGTGWILTAGSLGLLVSMDRSRARTAAAADEAGASAAALAEADDGRVAEEIPSDEDEFDEQDEDWEEAEESGAEEDEAGWEGEAWAEPEDEDEAEAEQDADAEDGAEDDPDDEGDDEEQWWGEADDESPAEEDEYEQDGYEDDDYTEADADPDAFDAPEPGGGTVAGR